MNASVDTTDAGETPLSPHLMSLFVAVMMRADKSVTAAGQSPSSPPALPLPPPHRDDWDERDLRSACYDALSCLVDKAGEKDHPHLLNLLAEVTKRLAASFAKPPPASKDEFEERQTLQTALVVLVQVCACVGVGCVCGKCGVG